jgi:hypothetical protein
MSSFLKYAADPTSHGNSDRGQLHFGRTHLDGQPFRGNPGMLLKNDEFADYTETVYDADVAVLEATDPDDRKKLAKIVDNIANGVYRALQFDHHWYTKPNGEPGVKVFLMWCSGQKELAKYRMSPGMLNSMGG